MIFDGKLDREFIKRVLGNRVLRLNFEPADFTTPKYQNEIRALYRFAGKLQLRTYIDPSSISTSSLKSAVDKLRASSGSEYDRVFSETYNNAFGPGEVLLFLLINGAKLSGKNESFDVTAGSKKFEVKAVEINQASAGSTREGMKPAYAGFFFGGKLGFIDESTQLFNLASAINDKEKTNYIEYSKSKGISRTHIDRLRKYNKPLDIKSGNRVQTFEEIENSFRKKVIGYFQGKTVIFLSAKSPRRGDIFSVETITASDRNRIHIESVTMNNNIKPFIDVK